MLQHQTSSKLLHAITKARPLPSPSLHASLLQQHRHDSSADESSSKRSRKVDASDTRILAIRDILYSPSSAPSYHPTGIPSIDTSPVREKIRVANIQARQTRAKELSHIDAQVAHVKDTIERAWAVSKMDEKERLMAEVRKKYAAVRTAMLVLDRLDGRLFRATLASNRVERGTNTYPVASAVSSERTRNSEDGTEQQHPVLVFPRRLRVPTDTPPSKGWKYHIRPDC